MVVKFQGYVLQTFKCALNRIFHFLSYTCLNELSTQLIFLFSSSW